MLVITETLVLSLSICIMSEILLNSQSWSNKFLLTRFTSLCHDFESYVHVSTPPIITYPGTLLG